MDMLYLGWSGRLLVAVVKVCNTNLASSSKIGAGIADPLHQLRGKLCDSKNFRERYRTLKISENFKIEYNDKLHRIYANA